MGVHADKDNQVESHVSQNGLVVEKIRRKSGSATVQHYVEGEDGTIETLIRCFDSMAHQCTHMFYDGEFFYDFHQMPSDLSNWKLIQEQAKTIFRSFLIARETPNNSLRPVYGGPRSPDETP